MEKLPGVQSATVSLNEGRVMIRLEPGNTIRMAQLRQSVERNGFTPRDAAVTAQAEVIAKGDQLQVKISGTNDVYELATTAHADAVQQQLRKRAGQSVVIEAIIPAPADPKAPPVIQVNSVKPPVARP